MTLYCSWVQTLIMVCEALHNLPHEPTVQLISPHSLPTAPLHSSSHADPHAPQGPHICCSLVPAFGLANFSPALGLSLSIPSLALPALTPTVCQQFVSCCHICAFTTAAVSYSSLDYGHHLYCIPVSPVLSGKHDTESTLNDKCGMKNKQHLNFT